MKRLKPQKSHIILVILVALFIQLLGPGAQADTLRLYYGSEPSENFMQAHPGVEIVYTDYERDYRNTYEIIAALLTNTFDYDVFELGTWKYDMHQIMDKGYCIDLSQSDLIRTELERMHPVISAQMKRNGIIYAIPRSIQCDVYLTDQEGWLAAGFSEQDIPQSFPQLLDFLEAWCHRAQSTKDERIKVRNTWDESVYGPHSYTTWLVQTLIENHIMQCGFAGLPIRFEDETFLDLLRRSKEVGSLLYETEPVPNASHQLIESASGGGSRWPDNVPGRLISMRLSAGQPKLISATLSSLAVYARTGQMTLAIAYLEDVLTQRTDKWNQPYFSQAMLYQNAQPIKNPNTQEELDSTNARIEDMKRKLEDEHLSLSEKNELRASLEKSEAMLIEIKQREYRLSPEQLRDYQALVDKLYFPTPGPFYVTTDTGQEVLKLIARYCASNISANEIMMELDRIARMMELEGM